MCPISVIFFYYLYSTDFYHCAFDLLQTDSRIGERFSANSSDLHAFTETKLLLFVIWSIMLFL